MGNVLGENFSGNIKKQIEVRQKYFGDRKDSAEYIKKRNQLLYANAPFIKLCSSVNISEDLATSKLGIDKKYSGNALAKEFILFSGTSTESDPYEVVTERDEEGNPTKTETRVNNKLRAGLNNNKSILGNQAYGLGGLDFGQVPQPGITDLSVNYKNRGSLREAQINLKAYNQKQFEIIDVLYLRLGYTVLLEWGHSQYLSNKEEIVNFNSTLSNQFLDGKINNYFDALSLAEVNSASKDGNYEVMVGKITNFNWSFNPDGSYDINITLISIGDIIESLKIDTLFTEESDISSDITALAKKKAKDSVILQFQVRFAFTSTFGWYYFIKKEDGTFITGDEASTYNLVPNPADFKGSTDSIFYPAYKKSEALAAAEKYYTSILQGFSSNRTPITVGGAFTSTELAALTSELGKKLMSLKYGLDNQQGTAANQSGNIEYYQGFGGQDTADFFKLKFNANNSKANQTSKYYIRLGYLLDILENEIIFKYKNGNDTQPCLTLDNGSDNYFYINQYSYGADLDKAISRKAGFVFGANTYNLVDLPSTSNVPLQVEYGVGKLMNVFLNIDFLSNTIVKSFSSSGGLDLFSFLKEICDGINSSFGGVNKLEPVLDEKENRVYLLDSTPLLLSEQQKLKYLLNKDTSQFQIYGFNPVGESSYDVDGGFIKNFSIRSEITNNLATQLSIGAQAISNVVTENATGFQSWNQGITDRIAPQKVDPDGEDPTQPSTKDYSELINEIQELLKKYQDKTISPDEIQILVKHNKTTQKYFSARLSQSAKTASAGTEAFIPINLNLTMFGLSGMKIYQTFEINSKFLPTNYKDKLKFLIKKINHNISLKGWETTIETLVTPKITSENSSDIVTEAKQIWPFGTSIPTPQQFSNAVQQATQQIQAQQAVIVIIDTAPSISSVGRVPISTLTASTTVIDIIKFHESYQKFIYDDGVYPTKPYRYADGPPIGTLTIGYGTTRVNGAAIKREDAEPPRALSAGITEAQATTYLLEDVARFEAQFKAYHPNAVFTQYEYDALIDLIYNTGAGVLDPSKRNAGGSLTLGQMIEQKQYDLIPAKIREFNQSGGQVLAGLQKRREAEVRLWLKDNPGTNPP
jgi:lysozyme